VGDLAKAAAQVKKSSRFELALLRGLHLKLRDVARDLAAAACFTLDSLLLLFFVIRQRASQLENFVTVSAEKFICRHGQQPP
jgi:hypothetical protein